jgi:DNA polymerase-1
MLLQVHDELLFEVAESEAVEMSRLVPETMSGAMELSIPLKVDIASGRNWAELKG